MTNPEAAAWLEEQIDLGEGVAASGGWLPSTGEIAVDTSEPGFQMPDELYALYAQMLELLPRGLRDSLALGRWVLEEAPMPSANPEPVVIERLTYDLPTEYVDDVHPDPETWVRSLRAGGS